MKVYTKFIVVPIDDVKPYWNNPRLNDKTRHALVDVYKKIGFNQPILIDENMTIVKGHARFYAAKIAGFDSIPCILSQATEEENKADRILDNKIQELSTWDPSTLEAELFKIDIQIEGVSFDFGAPEVKYNEEAGMPAQDFEIDTRRYIDTICPKCGTALRFDIDELAQREVVK